MAEQRTNDQISPKGGEEFTPEVLSKMSLEDLEKIRVEIEKRLDQRGSSRPVTHANNWLDNKKNERDYLNLVRGAIADKMDEGIKTFNEFNSIDENWSVSDKVDNPLSAGDITDFILKSVGKENDPLRDIIELFIQKQLDLR